MKLLEIVLKVIIIVTILLVKNGYGSDSLSASFFKLPPLFRQDAWGMGIDLAFVLYGLETIGRDAYAILIAKKFDKYSQHPMSIDAATDLYDTYAPLLVTWLQAFMINFDGYAAANHSINTTITNFLNNGGCPLPAQFVDKIAYLVNSLKHQAEQMMEPNVSQRYFPGSNTQYFNSKQMFVKLVQKIRPYNDQDASMAVDKE